MKKMSGTKVFMIVCSVCFAVIAAAVMKAFDIPRKALNKINEYIETRNDD